MNEGRMPACNVIPLAGDVIASVPEVLSGHNSSNLQPNKQALSGGNRCGHNKNKIRVSPVFRKAISDPRMPHAISESGRRLAYLAKRVRGGITKEDVERDRVKSNGMLHWFVALFEDTMFLRLLYHSNNALRGRRRRSESFESIVFLTLGTLIAGLNLHEMAYGFYDGSLKFIYSDYARIAKKSGITLSRVSRAMRILQKVGLVSVTPIFKTLNDGKVITLETRVYVSDKVFHLLGIYPEFLKDREYALQKHGAKVAKAEAKRKRLDIFSKPLLPKVDSKTRKVVKQVTQGCQSLADRFSIPRGRDKGDGVSILAQVSNLVSKGMSPAQAMETVRKSRSPPH